MSGVLTANGLLSPTLRSGDWRARLRPRPSQISATFLDGNKASITNLWATFLDRN